MNCISSARTISVQWREPSVNQQCVDYFHITLANSSLTTDCGDTTGTEYSIDHDLLPCSDYQVTIFSVMKQYWKDVGVDLAISSVSQNISTDVGK